MRLGLRLPQRLGVDLQHDVVEAARTAEAAGYASLWTYERLLFPETPAEPYAPTRADRGRFLDETLDVFDAVWGPDPVTFRGPRVVIDNASVLPKPVSKIPVMLGGGSSKAVQRIAKRADGWLPLLTSPGPAGAAELRASWDRIREMASEYGRDTSRMEMVVVGNVTFTDRPAGPDRSAFVGTLDQVMDDVRTAAEAGADELIVDLNLQDWFTTTRQMLETAVEIRERAAAS